MTEGEMKRVDVWLEPQDMEVIEYLKTEYGGTASSAVRIGLRLIRKYRNIPEGSVNFRTDEA